MKTNLTRLLAAIAALSCGAVWGQNYNFFAPGPVSKTATQYVSTTGSDTNDCLSWQSACATVTQAISNLPATGGLVEVGSGSFACWSYTASGTQPEIHLRGRGVGSFGAANSGSTSLYTGGDATVFTNSTAATTCITIAGNSSGQNNPVWILEDFAVVSTGGTAITFTAPPSGTSATLTSNFTGTTGNYVVLLSTGQAIVTLLTNGSATATFNQAGICNTGGCATPTVNATYVTTSNGISLSNGTHAILRRVASKFHGASGIISTNSYWLEFDTVYGIGNALYGWDGAAGNNNLVLVTNGKFYGNGNAGVRSGAGSGSVQTFVNTDFSVNGLNGLGYGAQVRNGGPYNFLGCFFETNPQGGLHNDAVGTNVNVTGSFFTGNNVQQYGIQALGTTDVYNVIGNQFTGHRFASIDNTQGQGGTIQQNLAQEGIAHAFLFRYNGSPSVGSSPSVSDTLAYQTFNNQTVSAQTLSVAGAVTIDASKTTTGGYQQITLAANATSSTLTNLYTSQVVTIQWIENSTGGFTYAWPTNVKFTGGTAPNGTTLSTMNGITCIYDGTNCVETARSTAVPYP